MPELSIPPDVAAFLGLTNAGTSYAGGINDATGYLTPDQLQYTPEGRAYLDQLYNIYLSNYQAGTPGYGLPGEAGGNPDKLRGIITNAALYGTDNAALADWLKGTSATAKAVGGIPQMPQVQTIAWKQVQMADDLARDVQQAQNDTQKWLQQANADLQLKLQAGQISADQAAQASQQAHQKAMQAEELALGYAELAWEKEYGTQNIQLLRDRLAWDREYGTRELDIRDRAQGLEEDKFGLDKAFKEAEMRANPFNAVSYALYSRGQGLPNTGTSAYGQPMTTLDNSGQLPFLQVLQQNGAQLPMFQNSSSPMAGQIGGNAAPNPNQISQANFGNMSTAERGITDSLARFKGFNSDDYWKLMQNSWNTAGQGNLNFGGTRMM